MKHIRALTKEGKLRNRNDEAEVFGRLVSWAKVRQQQGRHVSEAEALLELQAIRKHFRRSRELFGLRSARRTEFRKIYVRAYVRLLLENWLNQ